LHLLRIITQLKIEVESQKWLEAPVPGDPECDLEMLWQVCEQNSIAKHLATFFCEARGRGVGLWDTHGSQK
jgi:hypothetical protein